MPLILRRLFLFAFTLGLCWQTAVAGDWPQILGPTRNGIAQDEKLADSWPANGPQVVWKQKIGSGLAGPVVADGRVVLFQRIGDNDVVQAYDAQTGKPGWKNQFPTTFRPSINPDDGPRSIPLIHKDRVYLFGAAGDLRCVSFADGQEIWVRHTHKEFGAREGYFGAGSSPIVVDGKLLLNVGGFRGPAVVAFSLDKGKTLWEAVKDTASYSSPVVATLNGKQQVIFITRMNLVSLDPADGSVQFEIPFGRRGPTVNGANPLVIGNRVFATSHYGVGGLMVEVGDAAPKTIWENDEALSSHYPTPIYYDGNLYGIHGQERASPLHLRCVDAKTGGVLWSEDNFGIGTFIMADGKLLITKLDGEIVLVQPSPKKYTELSRAQIGQSTARALPALADGKLYLRDEQFLYCVDVGR
ncbi:outer membrane biogenesis protein BamB [Symmachiella dynata]|uniref:Outer membrane biogenesis protein BamB n=1 Tax=Symmachiella dynata TaxID=2527995 RepID=A0A517ZM59_9PLAN|nr:PQQ-binding-like beta-propeller repeat protein [Symmachiella dynata]QDU43556.1 outer membrane biogenesis protein BamB [Symmachiella dynata]